MNGESFVEFAEWAERHKWEEFATSEEDGITNHFYVTPYGRMLEVLEGDDSIVAMYDKKVVEAEE